MILALDTDVLIQLMNHDAEHHAAVHARLREEVTAKNASLGLTPQVLFEFLHVVTDAKRFARPLPMAQATRAVREMWDADHVARIVAKPNVLHRTLELLDLHRLGRKRILDTALATTLELAGVRRLATMNPADFQVFEFLELVEVV